MKLKIACQGVACQGVLQTNTIILVSVMLKKYRELSCLRFGRGDNAKIVCLCAALQTHTTTKVPIIPKKAFERSVIN